jgi:hypothetical protein
MNREELAYAGGLFEGEGSVSLANGRLGRNRPRARLSLEMTDLEPLERFIAAVGIGHVIGPYERKGVGLRKPIYAVTYTKFEQVQAIVAMLWPWLGPRRRKRAAEVLGGDATFTGRTKRYQDALVRSLNASG